MKLGNHSIDDAPHHEYDRHSPPQSRNYRRSRERSPAGAWPRSHSRGPIHTQREAPSQVTKVKSHGDIPPPPPQPKSPQLHVESSSGVPTFADLPPEQPPHHSTPVIKSEIAADSAMVVEITLPASNTELVETDTETRKEPEQEVKPAVEVVVKTRERSSSPPRQPRFRGPQPPPTHPRRTSRSPPRGPRNSAGNHPRGNVTPTGPASYHPTGPRGQRRPFNTAAPLPAPSITQVSASMEMQPVIVPETEVKIPIPQIPIKKLPPSLTPDLDAEVSFFSSPISHLTRI